eukprot:m.1444796 g.1444796  ORF g.1444796 m.1444796 type:complete len:434 (-) comp25106_c0_seq20:1182-2483(-)
MSHCAMRALSEVLAWAFLLGLAGDILEVSSATESEFSSIQAVMCSNVSVVSDDVYASSSDDIEDMICLAYYPSPFSFSQFPFSTTCTEIGGTLHNPATGDYGEQPCCFPNASACDGTSLKVNTVSSADCRSGGAFEISGPTPSTMRTCSVYAGCPQGQYARQVPTATTSLLCSVVVYCGGGSLYEQIPATATTNAQCAQLEQCTLGTSYQIVQPTFSSDRVCAPCNDSCGAGEYIVRTCNLTANIACVGAASQQPPTERHALSTGDVAAIIACVLLAFIVATYVAMQWGRTLGAKTKKYIEGREMLLMEAEGREAEARADIDRMLAAWQIPERDVVFHRVFAEGMGWKIQLQHEGWCRDACVGLACAAPAVDTSWHVVVHTEMTRTRPDIPHGSSLVLLFPVCSRLDGCACIRNLWRGVGGHVEQHQGGNQAD